MKTIKTAHGINSGKHKTIRSISYAAMAVTLYITLFTTAFVPQAYGQPLVSSLEGEQMSLPTGGSVISDSTASGSKAVKLTANGEAWAPLELNRNATGLILRLRGDQCKGAPKVAVKIDGSLLKTMSVSATSWTDYPLMADIAAGTRMVTVGYTNNLSSKNCNRTIYIDVLTFSGPDTTAPLYTYQTVSNPERTEAYDTAGNLVATFTLGARTVALTGTERTFAEPAYTNATVTSDKWIRLYPTVFNGVVDETWLTAALQDSSPDLFQLSIQYTDTAPDIFNTDGLRIAGDADYGPLLADGTRQEGSDFNDYLGLPWTYGSTIDNPESAQYGSLDCSGYMRMAWGYRGGLPLSLSTDSGASIPRRAFQIYDSAPGTVIIANNGTQITDFSKFQPGDIVFQDANTDDGTQIDHMGMYLGVGSDGYHRFISSRKAANGPTMGDYGGASRLDGTGMYAKSLRAVRRF